MLVLDENLPAGQRQRLRDWRIHFRVVGLDIADSGTLDESLIPVLHRLPRLTFVSLDRNFYRADWWHSNYCLVWLDVADAEAAFFIRRFLRHAAFNTQGKRLGKVARVHSGGVHFWQSGKRALQAVHWHDA